MYENIENLYKKHSLYNKIKKKIFVLYIVVFPFLLIFNEMQNALLLFFSLLLLFFW